MLRCRKSTRSLDTSGLPFGEGCQKLSVTASVSLFGRDLMVHKFSATGCPWAIVPDWTLISGRRATNNYQPLPQPLIYSCHAEVVVSPHRMRPWRRLPNGIMSMMIQRWWSQCPVSSLRTLKKKVGSSRNFVVSSIAQTYRVFSLTWFLAG